MQAYATEITVSESGVVQLDKVPFAAGDVVQVFLLRKPKAPQRYERPLKGSVLRYDNPLAPVALKDWDALP